MAASDNPPPPKKFHAKPPSNNANRVPKSDSQSASNHRNINNNNNSGGSGGSSNSSSLQSHLDKYNHNDNKNRDNHPMKRSRDDLNADSGGGRPQPSKKARTDPHQQSQHNSGGNQRGNQKGNHKGNPNRKQNPKHGKPIADKQPNPASADPSLAPKIVAPPAPKSAAPKKSPATAVARTVHPSYGSSIRAMSTAGQCKWFCDRYFAQYRTEQQLEQFPVTAGAILKSENVSSDDQEITLGKFLASLPGIRKKLTTPTKVLVKAHPPVLVISSSAQRCCALITDIRDLIQDGCKVGKVFAKHFKLEEQAEFLKEHPVHIAVGTPNRILKLAELGHFHVDKCSLVVVDSVMNVKGYSVADLPDTKKDFFDFFHKYMRKTVSSGKCKVAMY